MGEVIVEIDGSDSHQCEHLAQLLDAFIADRLESDGGLHISVRTRCGPRGRLKKQVIFPSQQWADAFLAEWDNSLPPTAMAS